jgi:hypothetical protein
VGIIFNTPTVQCLRRGEADAALVAACNLTLDPALTGMLAGASFLAKVLLYRI